MTEKTVTVQELAAQFDELTQRHSKLAMRTARVQGVVENAQNELRRLSAEAELEFGTSDVNELTAMLKKMLEELPLEYARAQAALGEVEQSLAPIEAILASPNVSKQ